MSTSEVTPDLMTGSCGLAEADFYHVIFYAGSASNELVSILNAATLAHRRLELGWIGCTGIGANGAREARNTSDFPEGF